MVQLEFYRHCKNIKNISVKNNKKLAKKRETLSPLKTETWRCGLHAACMSSQYRTHSES